MATRKKKTHDDVGEVLREQQKNMPVEPTRRPIAASRAPQSLTDTQAAKERARRGKTPMEGQEPLGGSSVRGKKKQRGRGSNDGLQGT